MTLSPAWRTRFFAIGAAIVAIWIGGDIAQANYAGAGLIASLLAAFVAARVSRVSFPALILGIAIAGYVVGNRGFAQLSLAGSLPLLPAEATLALCCSVLAVQFAWRQQLPLRRDFMNILLLAWILMGVTRLIFDVRLFGFLAVRDFALVYYVAFFYVGQAVAQDPVNRRFLERVLLVSCTVLLPVYAAFTAWPDFFLGHLTFRGNPLIFYKSDIASTFFTVGAVLFFNRYENTRKTAWVVGSVLLAMATLSTGNRASMLGLAVAAGWLALRGRWRFALTLATAGSAGVLLMSLGAAVLRTPWEKTPAYALYERVQSLTDVRGEHSYSSESAKADNNRFRMVWWQAVIDETIDGNPYVGLGFGHDLAARFLREYYADDSEDFTARSPHNVLLTIFGRMGAIGLAAFLLVIASMARETWRALGDGEPSAPLWCSAWTILVSACFGVVLEGPMGAVVFWTILGIAHGQPKSEELKSDSPAAARDDVAGLAVG